MSRYSSEKDAHSYKQEFDAMSEEQQNAAIMNTGHVDESKWEKAKKISMESYGELRYPFIMYLYEKLGGR